MFWNNSGMTLRCKSALVFIWLVTIPALAWSGELAGLWQEYNDDTGNVEAFIRIEKLPDNTYAGSIEKIVSSTVESSALICKQCTGSLKNRPYLGLRILTGMKRKDELNFEGGEILDPDDGKTYRCRIRLAQDGKTIEVTGSLGFGWIGQSETWLRAR